MAQKKKQPDLKLDALRSVGALHPSPASVKDEHFYKSDFFDRRDLVQVRYEMLRRVRAEGHPITETAALFGVSRPTYYKIDEDFERNGLAGLLPRKRGPKGGYKLSEEVLLALTEARAEDAEIETASLLELARERFGVEVHPRTLERALALRKKKRP